MSKKVSADGFSKAVDDVLTTFSEEAQEATLDAVNETARGALKAVQAAAKAEGWGGGTYYKSLKATKSQQISMHIADYVYAGGEEYRLVHLLEHGHRGPFGRGKGAAARPHFAKGQEYIDDYFAKILEEALKKR